MDTKRLRRPAVGPLGLAFVLACAFAASVAAARHDISSNRRTLQMPSVETAVTVAAVPFSSNGCSGFRDAQFFSCCFVHDFAFWAGGTWTDRRAADKVLRRCVIDTGKDRLRGDVAYLLIRLGIVPGSIVNDGWARAWTNTQRNRFSSLTSDQRQIVAGEKQRVCQALNLNSATGNYVIDPQHLRAEPRELHARQARAFCGFAPPSR